MSVCCEFGPCKIKLVTEVKRFGKASLVGAKESVPNATVQSLEEAAAKGREESGCTVLRANAVRAQKPPSGRRGKLSA